MSAQAEALRKQLVRGRSAEAPPKDKSSSKKYLLTFVYMTVVLHLYGCICAFRCIMGEAMAFNPARCQHDSEIPMLVRSVLLAGITIMLIVIRVSPFPYVHSRDFTSICKLCQSDARETTHQRFFHRKACIYKTLLESKLMSGLSCLCLSAAERRRLDGFQNRCLRRIPRNSTLFSFPCSKQAVLHRAGSLQCRC